jgi:RecA/RadA recombinase
MKLRYFAIDSLNRVGGTKTLAEGRSVNDHLMGDKALTLQRVLEKVVPICRKYKITLIGTCQIRANLDAGQHGPKEKLGINWDSRHTFDYFIQAERAGAKEDKEDILGNKLESEIIKDARGNKDITGHKIYVKMLESSVGTPGRSGVITFDYKKGIINTFEELFELGKSTGFIKAAPGKKPGTYLVGDKEVFGKANAAEHMLDPSLAKAVIEHAKKLDTK